MFHSGDSGPLLTGWGGGAQDKLPWQFQALLHKAKAILGDVTLSLSRENLLGAESGSLSCPF
jgi:hypothetical protein